jgi:hypothetical protein
MSLSQPQRRSIVLVVGRPRAAFSHSGRLGSRPCWAYHSRTASMACSWSAGGMLLEPNHERGRTTVNQKAGARSPRLS